MKAETLKQIIKNIHTSKKYTTTINGVDKELGGAEFKTEIITKYKKISDADGEALLKSLTESKEVKPESKAALNGALEKSDKNKKQTE